VNERTDQRVEAGEAPAVTDDAVPTLEALAERHYRPGDVTRKHESYLALYTRLLEPRRDAPLRILELGVSSGASMLMWRDFLPRAMIIGIDIAAAPACIIDQPRIHFLKGSQDDPETLDRAAYLAGGFFDLIVDDASHLGYLTKRSFNYLFPRWLAPGGSYVIEDIGTAFLPAYPDGSEYVLPPWEDAVRGTELFTSHQFGMVGMVKQLIDHLMQELITGRRSYLPVRRIEIESNIAIIEKAREPGPPVPGPLPGTEAKPIVNQVAIRLAEIGLELARHDHQLSIQHEQLSALARALAGLLRWMKPLRIILRTFTGRGPRLEDR
jgi:hypothetical protein